MADIHDHAHELSNDIVTAPGPDKRWRG